ncbi:Prenylcysteine oxidase, partial [Caligus rogercresseyi]
IYAFLDKGQTFNSPVEFLQIISPHSKKNKNQPHSFVNLTHISIQDLLTQMDFNPELIQEIASVAMRCNYGQSLKEIHAFVGLVSLAGSDGSLWSVKEATREFLRHS